MDSLRALLHSEFIYLTPRARNQFQSLHKVANVGGTSTPLFNPRISIPIRRRIVCGVSSTQSREEEKAMKKSRSLERGKVRLNVRVDHQVKFGEQIVILGSTKELGSWKKRVPMNWTENGWVCDLEMKGGDIVEFKFVIVSKDRSLVWERGDNRALRLPGGGSFAVVCRWGATGEAVNLLPMDLEHNGEEVEGAGENGSASAGALLEAETSLFVGQWQGKAISFMRSNEHRNREAERRWDTSGLQGFALKLVQGDSNARNWWRKVIGVKIRVVTFGFHEKFLALLYLAF